MRSIGGRDSRQNLCGSGSRGVSLREKAGDLETITEYKKENYHGGPVAQWITCLTTIRRKKITPSCA